MIMICSDCETVFSYRTPGYQKKPVVLCPPCNGYIPEKKEPPRRPQTLEELQEYYAYHRSRNETYTQWLYGSVKIVQVDFFGGLPFYLNSVKIFDRVPGHEKCPHIANSGKPCNKPSGHGRHYHLVNSGIYSRLMYRCECGYLSFTRRVFERHLRRTWKKWLKTHRMVKPMKLPRPVRQISLVDTHQLSEGFAHIDTETTLPEPLTERPVDQPEPLQEVIV